MKLRTRTSLITANESGVTLVEFSIGVPVFFLMTVGLMLIIWLSWTTMSLNFAIAKAARWSVIGNTLVDPDTGQPLDRMASFISRFEEEARFYGVSPADVTLSICPATTPNCTTNSLGNSGSMILVRAEKPPINILGTKINFAPACTVLLLNE